MPAKDIYHDTVKSALVKEGWTITDDPFVLRWPHRETMYIDLAAERLLAAEKGGERIAVEIKSFVGDSEILDLRNALGQYILYHDILSRIEPERILYLAVRQYVYDNLFSEPIGRVLLENHRLKLLVFDEGNEVIVQWIP